MKIKINGLDARAVSFRCKVRGVPRGVELELSCKPVQHVSGDFARKNWEILLLHFLCMIFSIAHAICFYDWTYFITVSICV